MTQEDSRSHWPISLLSSFAAVGNIIIPLVLVRHLSPEEVGVFKIFFLYVMVLPTMSLTTGIASGIAYWAGRKDGRAAIQMSATLTLAVAVLFSSVVYYFHPSIASYLGWSPLFAELLAYALFGAIATGFFEEAAISSGKIWTGALFYSFFELIRAVCIVCAVIYWQTLEAVLVSHIAVTAVKVVAEMLYGWKLELIRFRLELPLLRSVLRYAFPVSCAWVFGVFVDNADQVILSQNIPAAEFALYSIGCLVIPPLLILEQSVTRVVIPQLSAAFESKRSAKAARLYGEAVQSMAFIMIPAVGGMIVFAEPIIELLFTQDYSAASSYLQFFALSYLALLLPFDVIARAQGDSRWILKHYVVFSLVSLIGAYCLSSIWGAWGALSALLLSKVVMRSYLIYWIQRNLAWNVSDYLPLRTLAAWSSIALLLGALCYLIRPVFSGDLQWFLVAGGGYSCLYFFAVVVWKHEILTESFDSPRVLYVLSLAEDCDSGSELREVSAELSKDRSWCVQLHEYQASIESGFSFRIFLNLLRIVFRGRVEILHTHESKGLLYARVVKLICPWRLTLIHSLPHGENHANVFEQVLCRFAPAVSVSIVNESEGLSMRELSARYAELYRSSTSSDKLEKKSLRTATVCLRAGAALQLVCLEKGVKEESS